MHCLDGLNQTLKGMDYYITYTNNIIIVVQESLGLVDTKESGRLEFPLTILSGDLDAFVHHLPS